MTSRIAQALAGAGAEVRCYFGHEHPFNPVFSELPRIRRWHRRGITLASRTADKGGILRLAAGVIAGACRISAFLRTCLWADPVVMVGGKGFLGNPKEYGLYRMLGRRVIHVFVGTASRPRYLSGYAKDVVANGRVHERKLRKLAQRARRQARRVQAISRQASLVVENPLGGHFQEKPFVNWFKLGIPLDLEALLAEPRVSDRTPPRVPGKVRILHCPSRPEIKGSARIEAVMKELLAEGLPIDFRKLTGVPHGQVLHEIAECDLVIDQLYSDFPLAGFAAEASAFGKPAVVGGYGWDLLAGSLGAEEMPPTVTCHPDDLANAVRALVTSEAARRVAGEKARDFLGRRWSQTAFSERFARLVSGDLPEDWLVAPETVRYTCGLGLESDEARRLIRALAERFGPGALGVDHLPALRDHLMAFARDDSKTS
ncbi:MAG: glycosyltransferase [Verrucomicrobiae bacterium]|nr:glycosyltransferase [Verrucomicrobiae bacterium]